MGKIPKRTPEQRAADEQLTREVQEIFARMRARFAAAEAREAAQRAKLRRWTFGLLGREPASGDGVAGGEMPRGGV